MKNVLVGIVSILLLIFSSPNSFAQEVTPAEISLTPTPTLSTIEYQLPYPGLLPDNPLYFIKAARDRIIDFLISDPLKKSEFYLLQADKRLQGGVYLADKEKFELSETTISKGENYFQDAITHIKRAKEQGMDITVSLGRMQTSSKKHSEVLKVLEKKAPNSLKDRYLKLRNRVEGFEKEVSALK